MPIEQEQQTQSANSPANIIILIGKDNKSDPKQLENRIEQAKAAAQKKAKEQGREIEFGEILILGDGIKTIQEVANEHEALLKSTKFTGDNTALLLLAHGMHNGKKDGGRFGGFMGDLRQSLQEFLKAYPHLTKFPIKTGFCHDGSMFKTATQKELKELEELGKLEDIDIDNIEELEELELLEELEELKIKRLEELTNKIKTNTDNSIIGGATISTSTNSKFSELTSDTIENIGQYIENIYSNPKSPLQQLIAEDLASPSSRYILHNNKITKLSRFLKGLNVESPKVKNHSLKELAKEFINHRKEELKQAYPDQKGFIETLGATEEELNVLTDKILNKALHLFAYRETESAAEILLSKEGEIDINRQNQDGSTALYLACENDYRGIVGMLLDKGANPDIKDKMKDSTALHSACYEGHKEIVKMLLDKGANPDIKDKMKGFTALHLACYKGHQKIVEMLLKKGANPNLQIKDGWTALYLACQKGHQGIVKMLLENENIKPNLQTKNGSTALHLACQEGRQEIVGMLLENENIKPNLQTKNGSTALHLACQEGRQEIVKMLVDKGADINLTNKEGKTALDVARENNRQEIMDYLVSHGALSGTELSQKKSSKSSEAKDGETPSSSPVPTGNPAILASEGETKNR